MSHLKSDRSMKHHLSIPFFLFIVSLSGCLAHLSSSQDEADSAANTDLAAATILPSHNEYDVEFFEDSCPFETEETEAITCGYLTVPENRAQPDDVTVEIAVAIIASWSSMPRPDPVLYLEGGPGGSALLGIDDWLESPLREERQIILFDQRGTGFSWPNLACPEVDAVDANDTFAGVPQIEAVEACRERLRGLGVDLSAYNSMTSAADVHDLRLALGIEEWNLFGISYGTRLALTVMRDYPDGVRSAVLDSVYPPNVDAYTVAPQTQADAILALIAECAADQACNALYPDLEQDLYALIDTLNEEPFETDDEFFTGDDLVHALVSHLYDTTLIPLLPAAIGEAAAGDFTLWLDLAGNDEDYSGWKRSHSTIVRQDEVNDLVPDDAQGMFYSVECNEETPFGDLTQARLLMEEYAPQIAEPLLAELEELYAECAIWGAGEADSIESASVRSDTRTLLLTGQLDPVTPPAWAKLADVSLSNAFYVELPRAGHSVSSDGDCTMQIIVDFLAELDADPDSSCAESVPPFTFQ